jgi:hypothetical protein
MVHCDYSDQGKKDMLLRGLSRELKAALTSQALIPESGPELVGLPHLFYFLVNDKRKS